MQGKRGAQPPPDEATLQQAALAHLARFGATRATLTRALDRAVARWARGAAAEATPEAVAAARRAVRAVVDRLAASGAVDDAAFAESRGRRLLRTGASRRAAQVHLAARGVAGAVLQAAVPPDPEREFAAAVAFARRRRLGPFRTTAALPGQARRDLAAFARAGFEQAAARRALALSPEAAEAVLARLRQP